MFFGHKAELRLLFLAQSVSQGCEFADASALFHAATDVSALRFHSTTNSV